MKPSPFNGVPAATLLLSIPWDAEALSFGDIVGVLEGEGVKGVEKGWALEVDVAGGTGSGCVRTEVVDMTRNEG